MTKLCIFVGMFVGSCVGGLIADPLGFWWAFFASGVGSLVGVYYGWKLGRHLDR
jgi:dipeptide/tripeptide permease